MYDLEEQQKKFEDCLWLLYNAGLSLEHYEFVHLDPIADFMIAIRWFKTREEMGPWLERFVTRAVRGESQYKTTIEVDMNWVDQAAWDRRVKKNKILVFERRAAIISMKWRF